MKTQTHECECCGKTLNPKTMVWLHLDCGTGLYSTEETPDSQGWFTFGKACARNVLKNGGEIVHQD